MKIKIICSEKYLNLCNLSTNQSKYIFNKIIFNKRPEHQTRKSFGINKLIEFSFNRIYFSRFTLGGRCMQID